MDFSSVIHKAQKNQPSTTKSIKYYSTKFEPPKKEQKKNRDLSENVKKFLAKKEQEERDKSEEAKRKRDELLALRSQDKKATRRVNVMLKRTKSANQAVIDDAVDSDNTAVTLSGPMQPDEDDYGYVSQEATALYNKMMEKYSKMPDEPKFNLFKKKVSTNLSSTKDRVKAALEREREEAMQPHRRKRKRKENDAPDEVDEEHSKNEVESQKNPAPKPKPRPAVPALSFQDLIKIAEKKQHEPIVIETKVKEDEKLFTKKQKKEHEREREWRERREWKQTECETIQMSKSNTEKLQNPIVTAKIQSSDKTKSISKTSDMNKKQLPQGNNVRGINKLPSSSKMNKESDSRRKELSVKDSKVNVSRDGKPKKINEETISQKHQVQSKELKPKLPQSEVRPRQYLPGDVRAKHNVIDSKPKQFPPADLKPKQSPPTDLKPKKFPPTDLKSKQFPPANSNSRPSGSNGVKPKQFPPADVKRKQFPPPDVRSVKRNEFGGHKKPMGNKRRILDDDDSEYDSELDDFIDDGPECEEDYSSHIREIFGYDKSKYRYRDEDDVDNMETNFAQQMKEEVISTKYGIMEDLEDMRQEEEHKKRKALLKKKKFKQ